AQDLAAVLDAADLQDLARNPEGDLGDGLPPNRERIGVVKTSSGSHEIFLERVQSGKEPPIWLFSADTLKWVQKVRGDLGVSPVERYLSGTFLDVRLLGYPLWRLIGMILVVPISYALARFVTGLLLPVIPVLFRRVARRTVDYPADKLKWPISLLAMATIFYGISLIAFSAASRVFWGYVAATVATIAFTWIGLRMIDDAAGLIGSGPRRLFIGSGGIAMERLLTRLSKFLVVLTGVILLFYIAGVNLTAVLTGVGIGGIALALAAQKSLENLFGAMTIISDKPIRVGDFCRAGDFLGTVEDIGMRSTRIRTLGRTMVSVPNGQLIVMSLENFSLRDKFLFNHRIHVDTETSADQLRRCLMEIRTVFSGHSKIEAETARVNLSTFRDLSIEIEVFAYILDTSYEAFLVIQEELLLRIMEIVRGAGARFALPPMVPYPAQGRKANTS
ncbi:MAG: mechanosensitive ion channel family protein, partial [Deltaproteobacteria bacterium]|nr:mechanosensitive ion channel family protein [Deltaproteobacteria bacterium]